MKNKINSLRLEHTDDTTNDSLKNINSNYSVCALNSESIVGKITPCDIIILKNGEEIDAFVTEVGSDEIKYRKCDNPNGPTYTIKKSEVFMIKYPNGSKDVFENTKNQNNDQNSSSNNSVKNKNQNENDNRKFSGLAIAGFILSIVGLVMPIVAGIIAELIALIFGAISLSQTTRHSEKYRGKGMAIVSLILGLICTGIIVAVAAYAATL